MKVASAEAGRARLPAFDLHEPSDLIVMPGLVPGIHVLYPCHTKNS